MENKDFTQNILNKIENKSPKPKWYFISLNILRFIVIFFLLATAILSLSVFVYDLFENSQSLNWITNFDLDFIPWFLLEFIIIGIVGVLIILKLYSQTDWPLVRNKKLLTISALMILAVLSGVLAVEAWNDDLSKSILVGIRDRGERLPIHGNRGKLIRDRLDKNNLFDGKVIIINLDAEENVIDVENPVEKRSFVIKDKKLINRLQASRGDNTESIQLPNPNDIIKQGDRVVIKYKKTENKYELVEIRKLRPKGLPPFIPQPQSTKVIIERTKTGVIKVN